MEERRERMERRAGDARRESGERRRRGAVGPAGRTKPSPASLLILMVVGVVAVSAAASVLFGGGYGDETPHGKVLGTLQHVAKAEEVFHAAHGRFSASIPELRVAAADSVDVALTADADTWKAVVRHPVGLVCVQSGEVKRGRVVRDEAGCFAERK